MRALCWATPIALPFMTACAAAVPPNPFTPSALGPSTVLIPQSGFDDALLGRVLVDVPAKGRSLEDVSRPNDCADKLGEKTEQPFVQSVENTQELAPEGKARDALRTFGFEEDAEAATHVYYKLDFEKQVTRAATPEYLACCKEKGTCGVGFVSSLVYGQGVYATAAENRGEGSVDLPATAGLLKARILHKRFVNGYIAAVVTLPEEDPTKSLSILGDRAAVRVDLTEPELTGGAKDRFEAEKIQVVGNDRWPGRFGYVFRDGRGEITENEFVRRYEALVGTELRGAERNRNPVWLDSGIAATLAGAVLVGISLYLAIDTQTIEGFSAPPLPSSVPNCNYSTLILSGTVYELTCTRTNKSAATGLGIAGGALLGAATASFITYGARGYDGSKTDHVIPKASAERYAARYNQALLLQVSRHAAAMRWPEPQSGSLSPPSVRVLPTVSPSFTGVLLQF